MEKSSSGAAGSKKKSGAFTLKTLKEEFGKISWTGKEELFTLTKLVVGATFFFGMTIYLADLFIRNMLFALGVLFRLITS